MIYCLGLYLSGQTLRNQECPLNHQSQSFFHLNKISKLATYHFIRIVFVFHNNHVIVSVWKALNHSVNSKDFPVPAEEKFVNCSRFYNSYTYDTKLPSILHTRFHDDVNFYCFFCNCGIFTQAHCSEIAISTKPIFVGFVEGSDVRVATEAALVIVSPGILFKKRKLCYTDTRRSMDTAKVSYNKVM